MLSRKELPDQTTVGIIQGAAAGDLVLTARQLGFRVGFYTASKTVGVAAVADFIIRGDLTDLDKLKSFAVHCDFLAYSDGQLSSKLVRYLRHFTRIPRGAELLDLVHDRAVQHAFLNSIGIPVVPCSTVIHLNDIKRGLVSIGYPAILKPIQTSLLNGQELVLKDKLNIAAAAGMLSAGTYLLEPLYPNGRQFSVVTVTSKNGTRGTFPLVEKHYAHRHLIAINTLSDDSDRVGHRMKQVALKIAEKLSGYGCVEVSFILLRQNRFLVSGIHLVSKLTSVLFRRCPVNVLENCLRGWLGTDVASTYLPVPIVAAKLCVKQYDRVQGIWRSRPNWNLVSNLQIYHTGTVLIRTHTPEKTLRRLKTLGI